MKEDLNRAEIKRIKAIAVGLLATLKEEKIRVYQWRNKETTRDAVRVSIRDFLLEEIGPSDTLYTEDEILQKANDVFIHVHRAYPTVPSPCYADLVA